ncbi:SGNH/GDSL hydrolase family protein [Flavimarina sp. Hel_I_48]|uniref:SGNH/GDSL hydrolase family protein n=1 Tax=Flavimarina sp. Hel_I_48 TaxID=1392488 RepID=UPI0004DF0C18|nr:SGNH/GDSL hydrolase family protein [Flavimarina sp. Hel_I_48]
MSNKIILILVSTLVLSCATKPEETATFFNAAQQEFSYSGRTEIMNDSVQALISPAAHVVFQAEGDSITLLIGAQGEPHDFVVVEVNGQYKDRYEVQKDSVNRITIALPEGKNNEVGVYKATEASNGPILFYGAEAEKIASFDPKTVATIEFIGDSITCGFGADTEDIPCDTGEWYDQHNAYLAYGPRAARALNAGYRLNAVSGMGMYRNWNDEDQPVMGDVYATTYLDGNADKKWNFSGKSPDLVSIALGTNDLSDGEGEKERKPFDPEKYTSAYVALVQRIFNRNPDTKLALLTSPMVAGEKADLLLKCLQDVKTHFDTAHTVAIFEFDPMTPGGCGYHPDLEDHKVLAGELIPFYADLLKKS